VGIEGCTASAGLLYGFTLALDEVQGAVRGWPVSQIAIVSLRHAWQSHGLLCAVLC
jgi:hypothetical protein